MGINTGLSLQCLFCYASLLAPVEITQKGYCGGCACLLFSRIETIDEHLFEMTGNSRVQTFLNVYTWILNFVLLHLCWYKKSLITNRNLYQQLRIFMSCMQCQLTTQLIIDDVKEN